MNAQEFAKGLREIADWYEAHPDMPLPYDDGNGVLKVYDVEDSKEHASKVARALGTADKILEPSSDFFRLRGSFSGVRLSFVYNRAAVCERRVVGTKIIPAQPARPAEPEREVEVVEWDCHPILSESPE